MFYSESIGDQESGRLRSFNKRICICGDAAVGKTSLTRRFVTGKYENKYITTLGTVITKTTMEFPEKNISMKMQIWDISGQAEFKRTQGSAYRYAEAAFVVCDLLHPETAVNVFTWIENIQKYSNGGIPVIVLVNKYDLIERKKRNAAMIGDILADLNYPVYPASARTGLNVNEGFEILANRLIPMPDRLPLTAEEMISMPEIFENPYALLDYVIARYTRTFGNAEMSIHLIRKDAEGSGKAMHSEPREEAMRIIEKLAGIIDNFQGAEEGNKLKSEFMEAYSRTYW